ncbi:MULTISPECIES: efflux transporter outer membrane subunit [Myroides]|uniref:Efflux transporter outer membrane subunit n=1 Tax=Myroides albus TaxID=2562892 RepID=A0A6I3LKZ3_9FLAO|nr:MULTISPECIES: TolC family protein [Myroides]MTG97171.1 efflux transporter outer membrane subunit [Myroides albus]MVX35168.1 efflux transporter outer membrane subunit [Myroides sp. LoEW2-1]UVD78913.1 TolC family protein [Myroides albus]
MNSANKILKYTLYSAMVTGGLLVTSCAPQSKYRAPKLDVPDHYRGQDTLTMASDSTSIADIPWREFFEDEQLIELIDKGLAHNFDMLDAIKNLEIANQRAKQAKHEWLPSLNADLGNVNYQYKSKNYYGSASGNYYDHKGKEAPENMYVNSAQYTSALSLSWELDIWGKIRSKSAAALAEYLQTTEATKAVQTELIASIVEGYYNLLLLDAQMEVAQTNYDLTKNTLKIVELQRDAGQITSLAIQQTKNQMLVAKALIPSLKQQIANQENALSLLTGQLPNEIERNTKLADAKANETLATGVPLYMLSQRPDVQSAELDLKAKNALVGVAQTSRYPSLSIDVTGGLNSMLGKNWFNIPGSLFGGLIGEVAAPIFNKRKLKTDFKVAKIERERSEINLQKTVYGAIAEVTDALINLQTIDEQIDIAQEQVTTSRLGVKQSNLLFNSGYATYIEVINAQKNLLDSELNLNKFKQAKLLSRVNLYKALGGGWK